MSAGWQRSTLLEPISADQPCGQNLEDTALLASFDGYRLYGRSKPLDVASSAAGEGPKTLADRDERAPDWGEIKERSLEALGQSKDLRLLAHLAAAVLRTDGLPAFLDTLRVASGWLEVYWDQTYPLIDGDGMLRRSALNCFADPIAVIDRLRRVPLVSSRQHGVFSLRDIDIATGQAPPVGGEARPEEAPINAAFAALPIEELTGLLEAVSDGQRGLKAIDTRMRDVGTEAAPDLEPLTTQLARIDRVLRTQLAARPGAAAAEMDVQPEGAAASARPGFTGAIRTREEAVRALDAVSAYFRTNEPSSPVPLLCDRARSLVSRGFLEVLEDIAPDAVKQARAAGGLKD